MAATQKTTKSETPRRLKQAPYKRGRFSKRIKHPGLKLASSWLILRQSLGVIRRNKKIFGGILLVYTVISLVLVRGFGSTVGLSAAKESLISQGSVSAFSNGFSLLGSLFNSSGTADAVASTYQTMLFVIMSLAVIWVLRQIYAKDQSQTIPLKAAFYKSTTPLIPFLLVLFVICLHLIPFIAGSAIFSAIMSNGLAVTGFERLAWTGLLFILATWSLYLLSASLFALYIVTLKNVTPLQALRSAKDLVKYRRWTVVRKLVFLPIILLILVGVIMLPVVLWLTFIAEWIFFVLSLSILMVAHSYMYRLYRELL